MDLSVFLKATLTFVLISIIAKVSILEGKDIVVVGGGLAGIAAARRLLQDKTVTVTVLEAMRSRYGGRIWTHRDAAKGTRGADVDLGASMLNTKAVDNPLIKLAEKFELETRNAGTLQVIYPNKNGENLIFTGDNATDLYAEAFKPVLSALNNAKNSKEDVSVTSVFSDALDNAYTSESKPKYEKGLLEPIVKSFPTVVLQNFSALQYNINIDFGWDNILVDGMGALIDRLVQGSSGTEPPVKIQLNKVLRNVQLDHKRNKVLVRTTDRKQIIADAVIITLPVSVLKTDAVWFEPRLSEKKYKAFNDLGVGYSDKVIVGFDEVFWPKDVGTFMVFSSAVKNGFLQTWTNAYRMTGNPFLIGNMFSDDVLMWELKSEDEQKEIVVKILAEMFGEDAVLSRKITVFKHSSWSTDEFILGSVSYPRVGSSPDLWRTLQEPVCPYIYFAGSYTEASTNVDSLHGAYISGIRAAEQILNNSCNNKNQQNKAKKKAKEEL